MMSLNLAGRATAGDTGEWGPGADRSRRELLAQALRVAAGVTLFVSPAGALAMSAGSSPILRRVRVQGMSNAEDLALIPGTSWIITSASPTMAHPHPSSYFINSRTERSRPAFPDHCTPDPDRTAYGDLSPPNVINFHGLDVTRTADGRLILYQINHAVPGPTGQPAGRESIEVFEIVMGSDVPSLKWKGAIPLPPWAMANDCCALPGGGVAVTNTAFGGAQGFAMVLAGKSSGNVIEWRNRAEGWSIVEGTDVNAPNGIAASTDGKRLFVCSSATKQLHRISRSDPHRDRITIDVGIIADNLTWALDGSLLVAGGVGTMAEAFQASQAGNFNMPFRVIKIHPETMAQTILVDSGPTGCMVATALDAGRNQLWFGTIGLDDVIPVATL
jgi:hypothetical protein